MEATRKAGRPRVAVKVHTPRRSVRIGADDWGTIQAAASLAGVSVSEFIRAASLKAASRQKRGKPV